MSYLLGDSDLAARRLKLVAEVFAPSTKTFLLEAVRDHPSLTLDLGCGPGYTTKLLASVLKGASTIGIDISDKFLARASKSGTEGVSFCRHDICSVPFPVGPADVVYSRYLLLHLGEPNNTIGKWVSQLKAGGTLLLEELEEIGTIYPVYKQYIELVERGLAHQGKTMFVGPVIAAASLPETSNEMNRVCEVEVSSLDAARMFWMNMPVLKESEHVRAHYGDDELDLLEANLRRLAEGAAQGEEPLKWRLRQIALQRST